MADNDNRGQPAGGALACEDCGKLYSDFPLDVVLPNDQWHAIQGREGGVLCAGCIVARGSKLPGVTVAKLNFTDICQPAGGDGVAGTPSSRWAAEGKPDPHGSAYDCERAALAHGDMTDDELANAVFLAPNIGHLTAAKDRIRWLSRRLATAEQPATGQGEKLQAFKDYVHQRLDAMGVPVDPESPHKAAGCRIGGRLDWIEQRLAATGQGDYALVPRKLTDAMLAAHLAHMSVSKKPPAADKWLDLAQSAWDAMLAAAPTQEPQG